MSQYIEYDIESYPRIEGNLKYITAQVRKNFRGNRNKMEWGLL